MALAAKQNERMEMKRGPADVVPIPRPGSAAESKSVAKQVMQDYTDRATQIIRTTKESARKAYIQVRTQTSQGYSRVVAKGQSLGRRAQNRARQVKEEHPLQLIVIIAGSALVAGIAIRIWRSRTS